MMNSQPSARLNTFHGPKRQLVGNKAGQPPPAWKTNALPMSDHGDIGKGKNAMLQEHGSKIFLSRLPLDVGEKEVEELFRKTVGPLKECFLVYNSQGRSKGMAVVAFQRPGDAAAARAKYDGKIVDGRRPLKIEIVVDTTLPSVIPLPNQTPSLLIRLGEKLNQTVNAGPSLIPPVPPVRPVTQFRPMIISPAVIAPRRVRYKKGPKRVKKLLQNGSVTREQLDKDMEEYRAAADMTGL